MFDIIYFLPQNIKWLRQARRSIDPTIDSFTEEEKNATCMSKAEAPANNFCQKQKCVESTAQWSIRNLLVQCTQTF